MWKCKLCGKYFKIITNTHLKVVHHYKITDYSKKFGAKGCGFLRPNLLPKNDTRYIKWKKSLEKRPIVWCKGFTKETHPSVKRISETFKNNRIDNFAKWRTKKLRKGEFLAFPRKLKKTKELAELMGLILGDGNIYRFPRTEVLTISLNSNNKGLIKRCVQLIEKVFSKKAIINKSYKNCTRVRIYQKFISERLKIPDGNKGKKIISIPEWIWPSKNFLKSLLRGLYEAEGSLCIHKPTYTHKFLFCNRNKSLLNIVYRALKILNFHPHKSKYQVQISRKEEVEKISNLIRFRQY